MLLQVQLQLATDGLCVDIGFHPGIPFVQHQQHRFVHIIVYQQQGCLGGTDKVDRELIGIEQLPVVENTCPDTSCRPQQLSRNP